MHIDAFRKVFQQKKGITISTNHGVKGAEFDTVIAFGLFGENGAYPPTQNGIIHPQLLLKWA